MTLTRKLLAASVLAVAIAAPVFSAQANTDALALTLAERNTYTNPTQNGTASYAMATTTKWTAKRSNASTQWTWTRSTNVSPASMNSGLEQQR